MPAKRHLPRNDKSKRTGRGATKRSAQPSNQHNQRNNKQQQQSTMNKPKPSNLQAQAKRNTKRRTRNIENKKVAIHVAHNDRNGACMFLVARCGCGSFDV